MGSDDNQHKGAAPLLSLGLNYEDDEEDALEAELLAQVPAAGRAEGRHASPPVAEIKSAARPSESSDSDVGMELDEEPRAGEGGGVRNVAWIVKLGCTCRFASLHLSRNMFGMSTHEFSGFLEIVVNAGKQSKT